MGESLGLDRGSQLYGQKNGGGVGVWGRAVEKE